MTPLQQADVWVVAGPPGSGKSTTASLLLQILEPTPALLDKDTMFDPITAAMLHASGRPYGDREGSWYDEHIKPYEYAGLQATAREIRAYGCPVVVSAPFTASTRDYDRWQTVCNELGGGVVRLLWVTTDARTLRHRLDERGAKRDCGKFDDFDAFLARVKPEQSPPFPHYPVHNTLSEPRSLEEQLQIMISSVMSS